MKVLLVLLQIGLASWYGPGFQGHRTASGETYNQEELTAASTSIPLGSHVLVRNNKNGRTVTVRVNDKGPYIPGRILDLSWKAAYVLDILQDGTTEVSIYSIKRKIV